LQLVVLCCVGIDDVRVDVVVDVGVRVDVGVVSVVLQLML
jgi:hypothetical protein